MFKANKQEAYIKGYKTVQPGTFKGRDGADVAYDGYTGIILSVFDKNGELVDITCRFPNTTPGQDLYAKLRNLNLMSKILVDVEIQFSKGGNTKYFIVGYEPAK